MQRVCRWSHATREINNIESGVERIFKNASALLQNVFDLFHRPMLALRPHSNTGSILGIDQRV
jgi:hypothetical protein